MLLLASSHTRFFLRLTALLLLGGFSRLPLAQSASPSRKKEEEARVKALLNLLRKHQSPTLAPLLQAAPDLVPPPASSSGKQEKAWEERSPGKSKPIEPSSPAPAQKAKQSPGQGLSLLTLVSLLSLLLSLVYYTQRPLASPPWEELAPVNSDAQGRDEQPTHPD